MKAEARRRKAEGGRQSGASRRVLTAFCLLLSAFCFLAAAAAAQKRPKPALKESDARRAVAEARGLALRTGAVRVLEVSAAGAAPVTVRAEVTLGLRLARIADERAGGGFLAPKRWRAVELRVGDREWEDFDILAGALGAERVEAARRSVEEAVKEFEARVAAAGKGATVEPLTRGALTIKQLSALGSSAVAEVSVEATFRLERGAGRRWQAAEVSVAGEPGVELAALAESINTLKAARAR
ncbi:MAG TPA: hypothetical protein VD968_13870, partial [Pyrinomonadaceae bacterium]|nr:hypothetical protein [Pyrinomonadaceae bacterium]